MPNYELVRQRVTSYGDAAALLPKLIQIYNQCQEVSDSIQLYQGATNADFNTAIDSIFTTGERVQLASMLTNVNQLVTTWATNHATLLNTDIE